MRRTGPIPRVKLEELPSSYKEIDIGETDEEKRKAVAKYDAHVVLVKSSHSGSFYRLGILQSGDNECFYLRRPSGERERVHFHDLESLLIAFS